MTVSGGRARVVLLTRAGCHLCDEARTVVADVCRRRGVTFTETDVDTDAHLHDRYTDLVPVVLVDDVEQARYRVDERALARALA
jgi:glutaredoxin